MLEIFKDTYIEFTNKENPEYIRQREYFDRDLNNIKRYYRNKDSFINNNNMLIRLIKSFDLDFSSLENYLDYVTKVYRSKVRLNKITSNFNKGEVFENVIYNRKEFFLLVDKLDKVDFERDWKDYDSIRVLKHSFTDLSMNHPDRVSYEENEFDYMIYEIDVIGMMTQYYYWVKERNMMDRSTNPMYFVYQILMTNTIPSFNDIAIFNRFSNKLYGRESNPSKSRHTFAVRSFDSFIDKMSLEFIKDFKKSKDFYEKTLLNFKVLSKDNIKDSFKIRSLEITSNNRGLLLLSRLRIIEFLLDLSGKAGKRANNIRISLLRVLIKRMENNKDFQYITDDIYFLIETEIDYLKGKL